MNVYPQMEAPSLLQLVASVLGYTYLQKLPLRGSWLGEAETDEGQYRPTE